MIFLAEGFIGLLFVAGLFHTGEEYQTRDHFHVAADGQVVKSRDFWSYVYFTVITFTGVGYGDIVMVTTIGRILVSVFIVLFFAFFIVKINSIFRGIIMMYNSVRYRIQCRTRTPRVVLAATLSPLFLKEFLDDFLHPERHNEYIDFLLVGEAAPDHQIKSVIN